MDIASRIAKYQEKGFNRERAEINVLMEAAAFAIFKDFPEAFVFLEERHWCCITTGSGIPPT
jgi:hypothetical protein